MPKWEENNKNKEMAWWHGKRSCGRRQHQPSAHIPPADEVLGARDEMQHSLRGTYSSCLTELVAGLKGREKGLLIKPSPTAHSEMMIMAMPRIFRVLIYTC